MRFSNEQLMAYADGELDEATRAAIDAELAADPEVARAVERHRALRAALQADYQAVLEEPVPERLAALVARPAARPVTDLAERRAAGRADRPAQPPGTRRWALREWGAMAAAVMLGLFVGVFGLRQPQSPFSESGGQLLARGDLAAALNDRLASESQDGALRVGLSFRSTAGEYCRTFVLQERAAVAGLACRDPQAWRVRVLAATAPAGGELRTAAAMPAAVAQAVDATIDGEPLDAAAEAAARAAGWRPGGTR
jgi:negative regulator of sigma E activity